MRHRYLCALAGLLFSCGVKPAEKIERNLISFEMKDFKRESQAGCTSDTLPCARYEVTYPVFAGVDSTVSQRINALLDSVITQGYSEGLTQTFAQTADVFIEEYQNFRNEMPEVGLGWYFDATIDVAVSSDTLISMSITRDEFTGGAHPNASRVYLNIDPKDGGKVTLDDVLKPGYQETLTRAGEEAFRAYHELADTASLQANYFEFENNIFRLNDNYGFARDGIVFFYNSYEVAPYAVGPTEVLIPYEKLKDWL
ncbi:MAG TPA: DUF3298 domain-containing protein [Ohtaekwangia sp.]|nr:DUF3298 domain-containing protein [Ohtaekwangia sp.]